MSASVDERERLLVYVDKSRGHFSLALAHYGDDVRARVPWEAVVADLRARGVLVAVIDLSAASTDVDVMGRLEAGALENDALFVVGLESLLVSDDDRPRPTRAIATLNFNRDLLQARVRVPVVLWLSQRATRALAILAPDTFDVARTSFELAEPPAVADVEPAPRDDQRWPPRWLRRAPANARPPLEGRRETLAALFVEAEPERAGDLAASLANTCVALELDDDAARWLDEAARSHELAGNLGAAATARRQRGELAWFRGQDESARRDLDTAWALAQRIAGSDDPIAVATARPDVVAARGLLATGGAETAQIATSDPGGRDTSLPDTTLLERWRAGDRSAGSELLARHFTFLWIYFMHRVPDAAIEDLVEDVFLQFITTPSHDLGPRESVRARLAKIARDVVLQHLRHRHVRATVTPYESGKTQRFDASQDTLLVRDQALQELLSALSDISIEAMDMLEFHYFHELSIPEIAEILEIPPETVKTRLQTARAQLARAYAKGRDHLSDPDLDADLRALGRRLRQTPP